MNHGRGFPAWKRAIFIVFDRNEFLPLHLLVFLSRIALVEIMLPYLKKKNTDNQKMKPHEQW